MASPTRPSKAGTSPPALDAGALFAAAGLLGGYFWARSKCREHLNAAILAARLSHCAQDDAIKAIHLNQMRGHLRDWRFWSELRDAADVACKKMGKGGGL